MNVAKAAVLREFNKPLEIEEISIPEIKNGELLVKIAAAGVCGSDVHIFEGNDQRINLPLILGHEGVGKVVSINGEKNSLFGEGIREGDNIVWNRGISCENCFYCKILKEPSLCNQRWTYGIHRSSDMYPYLVGCFAEYMILDASTDIMLMPDSIQPEVLVSATCSGSTTAHAFDLVSPKPGDTVVIQGPGPLGLYAVAFAKRYGAGEIIVIGGTEDRLNMCLDFGATKVINRHKFSTADRRDIVLELTDGRGADVIYETVGHPEAVKEGLGLTRIGGSYLSIGFGEPRGTVDIDCFADVTRKNLRYQGVWVSDTKHTYNAVQLVLDNISLFSRMVDHKFPLSEVNEAIKVTKKKNSIKTVLIP